MKKLRVTPLNISCALLLAWILWEVLVISLNWQTIGIKLLLVFVLVIADQFFRFFFQRMKRIWIAELGFMIFTTIVAWIIGIW